MVDEVRLDGEQAAIANEIVDLDRQLDELDRAAQQSVEWGLRGSGTGVGALARARLQAADAARRAGLLTRRQELASRLRSSVEGAAE